MLSVRTRANAVLARHPLRAADAGQLGAALLVSEQLADPLISSASTSASARRPSGKGFAWPTPAIEELADLVLGEWIGGRPPPPSTEFAAFRLRKPEVAAMVTWSVTPSTATWGRPR